MYSNSVFAEHSHVYIEAGGGGGEGKKELVYFGGLSRIMSVQVDEERSYV